MIVLFRLDFINFFSGGFMKKALFMSLLSLLFFAGCDDGGSGSGNGDGGDKENTAPVAHAGANQAVETGAVVTLDGSKSSDKDGDTLSYTWQIISKPTESGAALSDVKAVKPTFTADKDGEYQVQLVVNDASLQSAPSSVIVTATTSKPFNGVVLQNGLDGYSGCSDAILANQTYLNLDDGNGTVESESGVATGNYGSKQFLYTHFCPT